MEKYFEVYIRMDSLISGGAGIEKKTFLNHIFSTSEESKAEFLNVLQYSLLAIIPILFLNKSIHFFIPDLDIDKSFFIILAEILFQIFFIFFAIIFIHRFITFFPTFSGFKYDHFSLTNLILFFFIFIFSIQSKLSNKINFFFDSFFDYFFDSHYKSNNDSSKKNYYY